MVPSFYSRDLFSEMDRLHRDMRRAVDAMSPSIRGFAQGYPALNIGSTPSSVEIYAFAPGSIRRRCGSSSTAGCSRSPANGPRP